ncbi:MAG: diguanylate cyclase, partial [Ruminiclostridium sp.]|nr:diguanylate cyclase [Ruminiclostridium sp.]
MKISRLYYDFDLGETSPYRNRKMQNLVVPGSEAGKPVVVYDSGEKSGFSFKVPYFYRGSEYVHSYIEFKEGIEEKDVNKDLCKLISDILYISGSRINMQMMLNYAETIDPQTGIPNSIFIGRKFEEITRTIPAENYVVLYINLQNFKYLNEVGTSKGGDEAIMQYSHKITGFVGEDECVCRMGGDN